MTVEAETLAELWAPAQGKNWSREGTPTEARTGHRAVGKQGCLRWGSPVFPRHALGCEEWGSPKHWIPKLLLSTFSS